MAMHPRTSGTEVVLLGAFFLIVAITAVFAVVPMVECNRCDKEGQFATEVVWGGKPAIYIDYCDCNTFFVLGDTGKRAKISLLRSLMKPMSLKK